MGLEETKKELAKIRAKYEDPRRWSWDKKDLEESKKKRPGKREGSGKYY